MGPVSLLNLRTVAVAVVAAEASRHHWLGAAGALGSVLFLLFGSDQQRHHDDDEHGEEEPHQHADDQHESVVAVVSLVELSRDYAFGEDLSVGAGPPLGATIQRDVEDVRAAVVALSDVVGDTRHLIG